MRKPIIGIVGRETVSRLERNIMHVEDGYRRSVIKCGGIPLLILPTQDIIYNFDNHENIPEMTNLEKEDLLETLKMCDGIIMPGGCRIFEYDKFICKYALQNNIPILGICLGMQIMASVDCGTERTVELIDNGVNHQIKEKFAHKFKLDKNSFLYSIVQNEEFMVNSKHKCNVKKTNEFDIVGYSEDGIIEAIELKKNDFAVGVQWHPEVIIDESVEARKLFEKFIEISGKNNNK
jgi:putative glutamine amidotransferase